MALYKDYTVRLKGEVIENYFVEEKIWQGATSTVYKGTNKNGRGRYGNTVAIKVLHPYRKEPLQIKMFVREARLQRKLNHKNIVKTYSLGRTRNFFYIVMEYISGSNLKVFSQNGIPPHKRLVEMFRDLAYTIDFIHGKKIVHNDIKPENILVDSVSGSLKLTDFGYAGSLKRLFNKKIPSGGTENYMAPERNMGIFTAKSDIYSFGVVMQEFLLEKINDGILYSIVNKATQKDPDKRYSSFSELIKDIQHYSYQKL